LGYEFGEVPGESPANRQLLFQQHPEFPRTGPSSRVVEGERARAHQGLSPPCFPFPSHNEMDSARVCNTHGQGAPPTPLGDASEIVQLSLPLLTRGNVFQH